MENNDLKEKIRKNVKEKIAVSNIREEFDIKSKKSRKIIYGITSSAAVFILGVGIIIGTNTFNNNQVEDTPYGISDLQDIKKNKKEALKTENELLELLQSILTENTNKNTTVEDKDVNVNEQPNENINTGYPDYYAGKYIDNNGNNVVLLCENNETNRRAICSLLGITENRTTFKTAKYSYNYLTNLQNKISKKMIDKEFTFVTLSAVMEDSNNIKVTVTSNNESDLNKIKALDTIGGAIDIEYNTNPSAKKDLLIEKE